MSDQAANDRSSAGARRAAIAIVPRANSNHLGNMRVPTAVGRPFQWSQRGSDRQWPSSDEAVAWIRQHGVTVIVLQVPDTGGPPPPGVQIEVVEFIDAYRAWQAQSESSES